MFETWKAGRAQRRAEAVQAAEEAKAGAILAAEGARVIGELTENLGRLRRQAALQEEWVPEPVRDEDVAGGWVGLTGGTTEDMTVNLPEARRRCRRLRLTSPTAKGIVRTFKRYVVGPGIQLTPVVEGTDDEEEVAAITAQAREVWQDFEKRNRMVEREADIVERWWTDGEAILRKFEQEEGKMSVRFIEPERLADPTGTHADGIECEKTQGEEEDAETPVAYHVLSPRTGQATRLPAGEVMHLKFDVSVNARRGIPLLFTPYNRVVKYDNWLEYRIILNNLRASIAVIRHHEAPAGPSALAGFADAQAQGTLTVPNPGGAGGTTSYRRQRIIPGTVIDAPPGVTYEYLEPKVNAADVKDDGRAILLSTAACVGVAEYMLTGDASNAAYASTMVSEAPAIKEFEDWQRSLGGYLETLWKEVMDHARTAGLVQLRAGVTLSCKAAGPRLVARDILKEAQSNLIKNTAGILSRQTWAQLEGLDYKEERKLIDADEAEQGLPGDWQQPDQSQAQDQGQEQGAGGQANRGQAGSGAGPHGEGGGKPA